MKHLYPILLASVTLALAACSDNADLPRPSTDAILGRQLVVEKFGSEVWESTVNYNTFFARCPDGSVWLVVIHGAQGASRFTSELPTRIGASTMIFPGTVPLPTEKP
jgi:hypothetical protein